ncbi:uncharacterized protein EDB91DRAFT_1248238 [Suillus paluster]|uniref:uncharacterized protein n=1 Tax=Suillus paluster TaxID=48578 RepID=UPI001B86247B|nr:uncharacterized protein EDB91DRAFT_1248238 [Suillus paluster]KAG1740855.1 hypothetical protein EDB91DRAFT_1248238 [Suillus paluster]
MAGQPNMDEDVERADPGPSNQRAYHDGQRDEKVCVMTRDNSAFVAAWMQRLQMLTLITTFLASIDGELFTRTSTPSLETVDASMASQELVYACFTGALVFHVCAAILGYVACFVLIRYQIVDAASSDAKGTEPSNPGLQHPETMHRTQRLLIPIPPFDGPLQMPFGLQVLSRMSTPPLDLLTRCYYTTLALSSAGFILALLGITAYAWVILQQTVGIFTTACLGVSIVACVWAVM